MELQNILSHVDHTLLKTDCVWEDIKILCDQAIQFGTASVCIPPCFVKQAKQYVKDKMKICTVIGFPNGYSTTQTKVFEAKDALANGADEIDMVINICDVKAGLFDRVKEEICALRQATKGFVLKVIIETCLLSDTEKIKLCEIVSDANADYIKTSTGFSTAGATREDIMLFAKHIKNGVKIKAAGGIKNLNDAQDFLNLGCDRLGTSKVVAAAILLTAPKQ